MASTFTNHNLKRRRQPITYAEVQSDPNPHYWNDQCGAWSIIRPVGADVTNLIQNPSFEFNTDGWELNTAFSNLTTTTEDPSYGIRSGSVTQPIATGAAGLLYQGTPTFPALTLTPGQTGFFSAWIKAPIGTVITVDMQRQAAVPGQIISTTGDGGNQFTATGDWQQVRTQLRFVQAVLPALATLQVAPQITVRQPRATSPFSFDIDGAIFTVNAQVDQFFDGSTGGTWNGPAHVSTSSISQYDRRFGDEQDFIDLGLDIIGDAGWGRPPVEPIVSSYAIQSGAHFQRLRYLPRTVTLTGVIQGCCELQEVAAKRRVIQRRIDYAFEKFCNEGLTLVYQPKSPCCGALIGPLHLRGCQYVGGLEGDRNNLHFERVTIQFTSYDVYWIDPTERTVTLTDGAVTRIVTDSTAPEIYPRIEFRNDSGAAVNLNLTSATTGITNTTIGNGIDFTIAATAVAAGESLLLDTDPRRFLLTDSAGADITEGIDHLTSAMGSPMLIPGVNQIQMAFNNPLPAGVTVLLKWNETYKSADDITGIGRCSACGC